MKKFLTLKTTFFASIFIFTGLFVTSFLVNKYLPTKQAQETQAVLGTSTAPFTGLSDANITFNIPAIINNDLTVNGTTTLNGNVIVKGKSINATGSVTAPNLLYSLTGGTGVTVTTGQTPTITNAGVLSVQGTTGAVTLTAGSGITISGTTISSSVSTSNAFGKVSDGTNTISAGSSTDTLTFSAGSGIALTTDITNKKITITNSGSSSTYTAYAVLYANGTGTATGLAPGTSGYFLQSNGSSAAPSWTSLATIDGLSITGTDPVLIQPTVTGALTLESNGAKAVIIDSGGTSTINIGTTNASAIALGNTTQNTTFTLSGNGLTTLGGNLTVKGTITSGVTSSATGGLILANSGGSGLTTLQSGNQGSTNITYTFPTSAPGNNNVLQSNSSGVLSWIASGGLGTNYWQLNSGVLSPATITNTLSVGTTGSLATMDVRNIIGTQATASISGATSFAGLTVDNSGSGDLFTASSSGQTRFVITQGGNVGIDKAIPTTALDISGDTKVFNSTNQNASLYSSNTFLDNTWNTNATWNAAGTTFSGTVARGSNLQLTSSFSYGGGGWLYRKPITINNTGNGSTLTNYQVQITTDTATPIAAGKMNSDCSDMRFSDSNGTTNLNYFLESGCNTSSTSVWVKVPSITASSNYTIYMYYGNASATSASSLSSVFARSVTNVQLHYRFDEATATTATDYSGNSLNGTPTGTAVVSGKFGNARSFNGSTDIITVPSSSLLNNGVFTLSAWINPNNISSTSRQIFGPNNATGGIEFRVDQTTGKLDLLKEGVVGIGTSTGAISINTWTHVAVTYDASGNYAFYINGSLSGSGTNLQTFNFNQFHVGGGRGGEYFAGNIDEPSIYNRVLTSSEISDMYNNYERFGTVANTEYIGAFTSPEPSISVGAESGNYTTGLQSWTSQTFDAGAGKTLQPNYLTAIYTLDGSDNIHPKFQVEGSSTGSFSGEQTVYPAGSSTYYQHGGTYAITSNTPLNISTQITTAYRYWKIIAYMDTGSNASDTPSIGSIRLQDNKPLILNTGGQYVGIGTASPLAALDVTGGATLSANLTFSGTTTTINQLNGGGLNFQTSTGGDAGLTSRLYLASNGYVGIGTATPGSLLDIIGGTVGIGTTSPLASFDVRGSLGTQPIASFSGKTSFAGLVVDNSGLGDLFTASSSGQNRFVITQAGNVGVGTINPNAVLAVGTTFTGTAFSNAFTVNAGALGGTAGNDLIAGSIGGTGSPNSFGLGVHLYREANGTSWSSAGIQLSFDVDNSNRAGAYLELSHTGNIGINTTTPNATLDLAASTGTNKIYLYDSGTDKYGFGIANSTLQLYYGATNGTTMQFGKYDGTTFTEFARFQSGQLGINSGANPFATLDVRGTIGTQPIASFSGTTSFAGLLVDNSGVGDLFTASKSGATKFTIANNGNVTMNGSLTQTGNQAITGSLSLTGYATISASLSVGTYSAPLGVGNALFSGQVGIGTSAPTQTLSVAGNESIYNSTTSRGDIYSSVNLDKLWNTTALFNSAGATFSAGMIAGDTTNALSVVAFPTNWTYRKPVTVNNTSNGNTLANYQVKLTIDTATLITATKMNSNCSDLRFTDTDGQTNLNYWIESGCNTSTTVVWVQVPSLAASANHTIYMYYGYAAASAASSSSNTFIRTITNVQGAWRMDEASGTNVADYSGNNNTGTATGTTIVAGKFGNARSFNGTTSDWVSVPNSASLQITGALTVEAWVKTTQSGGYGGIVSKMGAGNGAYEYALRDQSGTAEFGVSSNGSAFVDTNSGSTLISDGNWHHVVGVYTPSTSLQIYVDGVLRGTNSSGIPASLFSSTGGAAMGCTYTGPSECLNGTIDEPRIYNAALTSAQITDEYNNYGYATTSSANNEYVRKYSAPEPSSSFGSEASSANSSGLQSWYSDTLDAGSGKTYRPNFLTVNYTLDSSNIVPKFQIEGSNTGAFTGEQKVYPAGYATYYQSGGTYPISSGTQLDISSQIIDRYRYWKVVGYMDTGASLADTPTITNIELQDSQANVSLFANGNVGIGNTNAAFKLDVQDAQSATVAAMIRNIHTGASAGGLGISLGATNPGTSNYFLSFLDGKGEILGKIQGNGSNGVAYNTSGADFAEYFTADPAFNTTQNFPTGTLVCQNQNGVKPCDSTTDSSILGAVSENPGFSGGTPGIGKVLIALVGQVPVKVSTASGEIKNGDPLTFSLALGIAVKAVNSGPIVGHAVENFTDGNQSVLTAIQPGYFISPQSSGLASANTTLQLSLLSFQQNQSGNTAEVSTQSGALSLNSLSVGVATVSSDLRVKNNSIIEGILTVIDTTFTNNIIVNKLAEFFGNVIFHGNITFGGHATFAGDTVGHVTLTKGTQSGTITFTTTYQNIPAINATVAVLGTASASQTATAQAFFNEDIKYLITNTTTTGFTITLNKPAPFDITFTWTAFEPKDDTIKTVSQPVTSTISPTPTLGITPVPVATSSSSVIPTP